MFDLAIGFVVGVVVGHFVPMLYTKIVSYFTKAETAVTGAVSSSSTDTTSN